MVYWETPSIIKRILMRYHSTLSLQYLECVKSTAAVIPADGLLSDRPGLPLRPVHAEAAAAG